MKMHIQAASLGLDPAQQADLVRYIEERFEKLGRLTKRFEKSGEIQAYIEVSKPIKHHEQGKIYYAEFTMHLPQQTLRAEEYAENVEAAVDQVKDKIKKELTRYKEMHGRQRIRLSQRFANFRKGRF